MDDQIIIRRVQNGDVDAYARLVRKHHRNNIMKTDQFEQLLEIVAQSGVPFTLHEHGPPCLMRSLQHPISTP